MSFDTILIYMKNLHFVNISVENQQQHLFFHNIQTHLSEAVDQL